MKDLNLKGQTILAQHTTESTTESGIIIPDSADNPSPYFIVKAVGSDVDDEDIKEGVTFIVSPVVASRQPGIEINNQVYTIFNQQHVLGIIDPK